MVNRYGDSPWGRRNPAPSPEPSRRGILCWNPSKGVYTVELLGAKTEIAVQYKLGVLVSRALDKCRSGPGCFVSPPLVPADSNTFHS